MDTTSISCGFFFMLFMMKPAVSHESKISALQLPPSHQINDNTPPSLLHEENRATCDAFDLYPNVRYLLTDNGVERLITSQINRKTTIKSRNDNKEYVKSNFTNKNKVFHTRVNDSDLDHENQSKRRDRESKKYKDIISQLKILRKRRMRMEYRTKLKIKTDKFIDDNFPTSYATMDVSYGDKDIQLKGVLDSIENIVNQAANTKSNVLLNDALVSLKGLFLENGGSSPRTLVQFADALSLSYYLNNFDDNIMVHAINNYTKVLTSNLDSMTLYKIAAKKCVHLLRGLKWYSHAIAVQNTIIARFPDIAVDALNVLGTINLDMGNSKQAKNVFIRSLQLNPENNGYAKVNLGYLLYFEAMEEFSVMERPVLINGSWKSLLEPCINMIQTGVHTIQQSGEDRSYITPEIFYVLGDALRKIKENVKSEELFESAVGENMFNSFWQRTAFHVNSVKSKPFWELKETKIGYLLKRIKEDWKRIRGEALWALNSNLYKNQSEMIRDTGNWKVFQLYNLGKRVDENCLYAPVTCNFIQEIPQIAHNRRGIVKFSAMASGTHVFPHSGPSNLRLRAHLGLVIPGGNTDISVAAASSSRIRVLNEYRDWKDGEMLIFDDSFDHEVWHFDPQNLTRLILIIDMWHPYLTETQIASN